MEIQSGSIVVALKDIKAKKGETTSVKSGDYLPIEKESSGKIIILISENPNITIPELAEQLNMSTRGVEKQIQKLKEAGIIIRVGPAKGGHWVVKK